jgi:hypothetical protein
MEIEHWRRLVDSEDIRQTLSQYFLSVSARDWSKVLDCFVPNAAADYEFNVEQTIETQLELIRIGMERFDVSTIMGSNCVIEYQDDETASTQSLAFTAHQSSPASSERTRISTVRYDDAWRKCEDGRWRITSRKIETLWRAWLDPRFDDRAGDHRFAHEWRAQTKQ